MFVAAFAVGSLAAASLPACAERYLDDAAPTCEQTDTLVLMAQSVPTAELVPCIAAYPAGWHFDGMDVRNGRSTFTLDSDRAGDAAVRVTLDDRCDVRGATEIASDEAGARRFERIRRVVPDLRAVRYYVFRGGCVAYRFQFRGRGQALVNEVSLALGFTTRQSLADEVRRQSRGRLDL